MYTLFQTIYCSGVEGVDTRKYLSLLETEPWFPGYTARSSSLYGQFSQRGQLVTYWSRSVPRSHKWPWLPVCLTIMQVTHVKNGKMLNSD
jgi:hypothetical protein